MLMINILFYANDKCWKFINTYNHDQPKDNAKANAKVSCIHSIK